VRSVGLPGEYPSLAREHDVRRRPFKESNSTVGEIYSCLEGRMRAISLCISIAVRASADAFEKNLGDGAGRALLSAWMRSKESDVGVGS